MSGDAPAWISKLFATIDGADGPGFVAFLTDDAVFRFGNFPEVRGREAILAAVNGFWATIRKSRHDVLRVWPGGAATAVDGFVTYTRLDGSEVTVPFADVFVFRGDRIAEYLIYIDVAPLYAPSATS
jgi:ketosteroid isomerase-like protein